MPRTQLTIAFRQVEKLLRTRAVGKSPDGQLVERFALRRDEDAFAALVERHGPMVFGLCRRILRHREDAEDAFQAVFLVLSQRARSLRRPDAVGAWLYEVACHVSLRARRSQGRLPRQMLDSEPVCEDPESMEARTELASVIDEELRRIPAKYRTPLVLCYFENKTYAEAAVTLGWPAGTVSGRLARGREILRRRLTRRGVMLSTAALVTWLSESASMAAVPQALATSTVRMALLSLEGAVAAADVAASVTMLSQAIVRSMSIAKLKTVIAMSLLAGTLLAAGGLITHEYLLARAPTPSQPIQETKTTAGPAGEVRNAITATEPTIEDKIREAIGKAREYLKQRQRDGNWEDTAAIGLAGNRGGVTSLVLLALLEAGIKPDDDAIAAGVKHLRGIEPKETYVVGLQTAVLARVDPKKDKELLQRNVIWLLTTAIRDNNRRLAGWSYPAGRNISEPDNSNSQYAVLGLHEAAKAEVKIEDQTWKEIRDFYIATQSKDGGWSYRNTQGQFGDTTSLTMTCAGACGLYISSQHLNEKDGPAKEPTAKAMEYIASHFKIDDYPLWKFYNLYGVARLGQLSGLRDFTIKAQKIDWYKAGSEYLLKTQFPEGCWRAGGGPYDTNPVIATSFALLFLSSKDGIIRK